MNCNDFDGLFELYVLGTLERGEAEAMQEHLATGCSACTENMRLAIQETALLSAAVPQVEPPARLRRRIVASFLPQSEPKRSWNFVPWGVAAAALVALIVVGIGREEPSRKTEDARVATLSDESSRMAAMLQIVQAPGTKQVAFGKTDDAPQGSLFIHAKLGVAMTVANLPAAPAGWKYESWIVPKQGAPQPVESFPELPGSRAVTVVRGPVNVGDWTGLAVSLEPAGSQPIKPTKVIFSAPV
jgi:anti-sigma-K factor RskA